MAARNAFQPKPKAAERPVNFHSLQHILRAGWREAAVFPEQRRQENLITANSGYERKSNNFIQSFQCFAKINFSAEMEIPSFAGFKFDLNSAFKISFGKYSENFKKQ